MINATEARRLVTESDAVFQTLLAQVELEITRAAAAGKYHVPLRLWLQYTPPQLTPIQTRLKQELELKGFGVVIEKLYNEGPWHGGFRDDDTPESYYRMRVAW
jgi:hypothetical protein